MSAQISIGKEKAIALYKSGWWQEQPARAVARFQLSTVELSLPFDEFKRCVEEVLGRPVWTHEFAHPDALLAEFLGDTPRPTMDEILALIPTEKLMVLVTN